MNFITKHIVESVKEKLVYTAEVKLIDHIEKNRSVEGLVRKSSSTYNLIAHHPKGIFSKNRLSLTDETGALLYKITLDKFLSDTSGADLYDSEDELIGNVEKEDDVWAKKGVMERYHLELHGKKIGILNRKRSLKINISSTFNDWYMVCSTLQSDFIVYDSDDNLITKFSSSINLKNSKDEYVIQVKDSSNTELALLFFMTMLVITSE